MKVSVNPVINIESFVPSRGDIVVVDGLLFVLGASHFHANPNIQYSYILLNGVSTVASWEDSCQEAYDALPPELKQIGQNYFPQDHVALTVEWE